jgi:hypothetical protein
MYCAVHFFVRMPVQSMTACVRCFDMLCSAFVSKSLPIPRHLRHLSIVQSRVNMNMAQGFVTGGESSDCSHPPLVLINVHVPFKEPGQEEGCSSLRLFHTYTHTCWVGFIVVTPGFRLLSFETWSCQQNQRTFPQATQSNAFLENQALCLQGL